METHPCSLTLSREVKSAQQQNFRDLVFPPKIIPNLSFCPHPNFCLSSNSHFNHYPLFHVSFFISIHPMISKFAFLYMFLIICILLYCLKNYRILYGLLFCKPHCFSVRVSVLFDTLMMADELTMGSLGDPDDNNNNNNPYKRDLTVDDLSDTETQDFDSQFPPESLSGNYQLNFGICVFMLIIILIQVNFLTNLWDLFQFNQSPRIKYVLDCICANIDMWVYLEVLVFVVENKKWFLFAISGQYIILISQLGLINKGQVLIELKVECVSIYILKLVKTSAEGTLNFNEHLVSPPLKKHLSSQP